MAWTTDDFNTVTRQLADAVSKLNDAKSSINYSQNQLDRAKEAIPIYEAKVKELKERFDEIYKALNG